MRGTFRQTVFPTFWLRLAGLGGKSYVIQVQYKGETKWRNHILLEDVTKRQAEDAYFDEIAYFNKYLRANGGVISRFALLEVD